jgi:hypothetical protein
VVLAFTFIPWLASGRPSTGTITDRIRSTAESLKGEMEGEVEKVTEQAKALDFNKLSDQAREKLKGLGPQTVEPAGAAAPGAAGATPDQGSSVRELLKDVQKGREALKEMQKGP